MDNFIMLSQFIFYFKYFITNLIFEKFSSRTIVICLLNSYCLSNVLLQISHLKIFKYLSQILHLKSTHHEQFYNALSIYVLFQIFHFKSHICKVSNILSQILHLKKSHHEQFCNALSIYVLFQIFITNLTYEKYQMFCYKYYN